MNDQCLLCGHKAEYEDDILSGLCEPCFALMPLAQVQEFAVKKIPMSVLRERLEGRF